MPTRSKAHSADTPEAPTKQHALALLDALKAVPAPLTTPQQAEAFEELARDLQDVLHGPFGEAIGGHALDELLRVVTATFDAGKAKRFTDAILFALKLLSYSTSDATVECIVRLAKANFAADQFMWAVVLGAFGEGHPRAAEFFKALSKPLPEKFLAICLLDAANSAGRAGTLKSHPFNSPAGVKRLTEHLTSRKAATTSYAVSACGALPFISAAARKRLYALAVKHTSTEVRMEAGWAGAKAGDKAAVAFLTERCLDRTTSVQARTYLEELGLTKRIPAEALEPEFAAMAELCAWLAHPNEFGQPPTKIEPLDHRTLYWPPTNDIRPVWLFRYTYSTGQHRAKPVHGVGMVGSMTWSFLDETKPTMKPEDLYGLHCCLELEMNGDKRAPTKRSGKAGWALITAGPKARRSRR